MTPTQFRDMQILQQYARRYADGRRTYAASEVNAITARMIESGIAPIPDPACGDVFAEDGLREEAKANYVAKYGRDGRKA